MARRKEIDRFIAKSELGKEYTIIVYQNFLSAKTHDNPFGEIAGLKELVTSTGLHVNYINPNTFLIVASNETVTKI